MSRFADKANNPSIHFWLLAGFLTMVFLTGGASRTDVQSLVLLRPASILFCAIGLLTLRREQLFQHKWLFAGFVALMLLLIAHLVPLPPAIWQMLPGRAEVVAVDNLVGLKGVWRPLSLTPVNGLHSLVSLFVPLAILLLGIQLDRNDLYRLLPLLIALATLSGFLGLLQAIGNPQGPLYLYRITNNGSAVGLFANRNHAATLLACLLPMLAVFAATAQGTTDDQSRRQLLAAVIALVLAPLILVTGSRSGLLTAMIGLMAAFFLYRKPVEGRAVRRGQTAALFRPVAIIGAFAVISLGMLTFFFARAEAIERLFADTSGSNNRTAFWSICHDLFWKYFPWGSGAGSFVEAFQIVEPNIMLDPTYLNHAHNDWIETAVTFGLPGVVLLLAATIAYVYRMVRVWRRNGDIGRSVTFARMAGVCICLIAIASMSDYPLRTPTMMAYFAVLLLWFMKAERVNGQVAPITETEH